VDIQLHAIQEQHNHKTWLADNANMMIIIALLTATLPIIVTSLLCLYRLATVISPDRPKPVRKVQDVDKPSHLLVVLGSGGHTAEMTAMLQRAVSDGNKDLRLDWNRFAHRTWIVSSGDTISAERARSFEIAASQQRKVVAESESKTLERNNSESYAIHIIPRARKIHQPLYTAPVSSFRCLLSCLSILTGRETTSPNATKLDFPDLIICNGPATATIMIFASIILRFFDVGGCHSRGKMRTIYVESWARVKKLSLSGTLLLNVVDRFLVQWPQLVKPGGKAEFIGVLV
jgi:beta-1,4-N-acetylglucosaminyltransferase